MATNLVRTLLVLAPATAPAHHSLLVYDPGEIVEFEGEVTDVFWRNPHVRLTVRTLDEDGAEKIWTAEGGPVNQMERAGIDGAIVGVGDRIRVAGHPSSRRADEVRPVLIAVPNGGSYVLDEQSAMAFGLIDGDVPAATSAASTGVGPSAADDPDAEGIFRVWTNRDRHWVRQDAREWWARVHPLTPSAQAALDAWNPETDDLAAQCIPAGMPEAMLMPFPIEFVDQGDTIILHIEEWDNTRTIHLNADPEADPPYSRMGYSTGRWEGDTLIVETGRIDYPYFNDQGIPQSEAFEIVERFTLSEGDTRLDWTAVATDPETFTEPVVMAELHWDWIPGQQIKRYNCVVADN